MGRMKNWFLECQEDAWHLILEADLGEIPFSLDEAKEKFLKLHPNQDRLWQAFLAEYHGESDVGYDCCQNIANTENFIGDE